MISLLLVAAVTAAEPPAAAAAPVQPLSEVAHAIEAGRFEQARLKVSSWLNAAALAGSAALEQHMAVTLEAYSGDLDAAHANALSAQSLLPDVQRASDRFATLADQERSGGALTGSAGSGSVVQLLSQMSAQMDALGTTISTSQERVSQLLATGGEHLAVMRELVSAPGEVQPRADAFAAEIVQLTGLIAALEETSVAASVARAADDLSLGFIAPVADGVGQDLVVRQDAAMANIREAVAAQSAQLSQAAQAIMAEPEVAPRRFVSLSSAEAVLRYAGDFVPSWAGAISIDLLPVVLVLLLSVAHSAMRRDAAALDDAETMTAAEMMRAVALHNQMLASQPKTGERTDTPGETVLPEQEGEDATQLDEPERKDDDTVTTLPAFSQRKRTEGPVRP